MSDLHSPAQIEDNVWIDNSTGIYDLAQGGAVNETRAQTYIETWLNHNAFLIERRNVGISEMKDNA